MVIPCNEISLGREDFFLQLLLPTQRKIQEGEKDNQHPIQKTLLPEYNGSMFEWEVKPYPKRIITKLARGKKTPTLKIHSGSRISNESQHDRPIKIAGGLNKERHKMKRG